MKTLNSFFNRKNENASIKGFENFALSFNAMNKVRGGDGLPDIWLPDDDNE